jgi:hypothetical protein
MMDRNRISNGVALLLISFAVTIDGLEFFLTFLPLLGQAINLLLSVFAFCALGLWFALLGVNYFGGKKAGLKAATLFAVPVIEMVPLVSALPALTAGVVILIMATWSEDRGISASTRRQASKIASIARMKSSRAQAEAFKRARSMGLTKTESGEDS